MAVIVALAAWLGAARHVGAVRLAVAILIVGIPVSAILLQPDLGTILVYGAIAAGGHEMHAAALP